MEYNTRIAQNTQHGSNQLLYAGYFGAACACFNVTYPFVVCDCSRFLHRFPTLFWSLQGTVSAMCLTVGSISLIMSPCIPGLCAASAVVIGTHAKEWKYRHRQKGYYNFTTDEQFQLLRVACLVFYGCSFTFTGLDWLWGPVKKRKTARTDEKDATRNEQQRKQEKR